MKKEVIANMIDKEDELFMCGRQMSTEWNTAVFFKENRLEFTETKKKASLELSTGVH